MTFKHLNVASPVLGTDVTFCDLYQPLLPTRIRIVLFRFQRRPHNVEKSNMLV